METQAGPGQQKRTLAALWYAIACIALYGAAAHFALASFNKRSTGGAVGALVSGLLLLADSARLVYSGSMARKSLLVSGALSVFLGILTAAEGTNLGAYTDRCRMRDAEI